MRPRSPPAWAGRREGSFHGHEGEVVTLTRGCISPSPQPSPVKGEGEEPPSQSSPQMGEEGDHPARPPLWIPAPYRVRGRLFDKPAGQGRVSNPPLQARTAVRQQHRLPAGGHVGPPLRLGPRASPSSHPSPAPRRGGFQTRPYGSRATRCRAAAGESPSPRSTVERRGGKSPLPCSLFSCVVGLAVYQGGERPGCVESMGPAQGSGSCQCCSSFSLILRSAGVSSTGAGFSSFSSSMRSDPRAFLRMAALAFPSRRRCVRVRRVRGRVLALAGTGGFELGSG